MILKYDRQFDIFPSHIGLIIKRHLSQGMPAEDIATSTMFPLEAIKQYT